MNSCAAFKTFRLLLPSFFLLSFLAFGQGDRGTITGTITDPGGGVVASAMLQATQVETGAVYTAASSNTGNYTLSQLPTGTYSLAVTVPGFKKYVRQGLVLPVAQTLRIDVVLEVGAATESVTINADAPLLQTESGELSHNVKTDTMDNLPVLGTGANAGSAGIRNPYAVLQLLPGSDWRPDSSIRLNGNPSNTESLRVEGQDATSGLYSTQSMTQPSMEAIQEFSIDTSNYAAEFGQAGGGFFNATMKSGTNNFHGSAYDYYVNEFLNAGQPFTTTGAGELLRPRQRRNDYGGSFGGPVRIPKIFNGRDKLFFFVNFEQFRQTQIINNISSTVPTTAYRNGDFSQALAAANKMVGQDTAGRPVFANEIFDPHSDHIENGQLVRTPFPNNIIPHSELDPISLKIQQYIPLPSGPNANQLVNNFLPTYPLPRVSTIPSVKIDYLLSSKSKLSGYWARTSTSSPNSNGLPAPINPVGSNIVANTIRLNYDLTLTPTLLLHLGAGLVDTVYEQPIESFDPVSQLGLTGLYAQLFPYVNALNSSQGGMSLNLGPGTQSRIQNLKPTGNVSLTWVHGNHTYKAGGEVRIEGYIAQNNTYANSWMTFSANETSEPALNGVPVSAPVGFPYASFLLGGVDSGYIGVPTKSRVGNHNLSGFIQDSWKVSRTFTLDYGLRYDFQTYLQEQYGRLALFSADTPNPSAGNLPGAVQFDGYGPGRCNCNVAKNYPFAFGPRIGAAWQALPKTVIRVGAGVSYYKTGDNGLISFSTGSQNPYSSSAFSEPAYYLQNGFPYQVSWPNFNPGQLPFPGTITQPPLPITFDRNAGRPARQLQWSIGVQRELASNLALEVDYVGNRGVWWDSPYMANPNALTPQILAAHGLNLNNQADITLLTSPINSALAVSRGFGTLPYSGFPATASVAQSLRPFPQFGNLSYVQYDPVGDTWYNALQSKLTKRFSHGFDFTSSFTWSKQQDIGVEEAVSAGGPVFPATNDIFNRQQNKYLSGFDQPFLFVFAGNYTTPHLHAWDSAPGKALGWLARDWRLGAVLRYASGLPIMSPISSNGINSVLFRATGPVGSTGGTFMDRVPGQPLYTVDLNCHCYDPNSTFVLNKNAWVDPPAGQFGTAAAYYNDYRYQRRPVENMSLARIFRIRESMSLQIRAEFTNIFNRTEVNNPTSTSATAPQTVSNGQTTAGFGYINNGTTFSTPRSGQLVARFEF